MGSTALGGAVIVIDGFLIADNISFASDAGK
jgi:hypothetical protein